MNQDLVIVLLKKNWCSTLSFSICTMGPFCNNGASLVAQTVINPPAMQETQVQLQGQEDGEGNDYPLQYSCLENSMDRGALQSMGSERVGHN